MSSDAATYFIQDTDGQANTISWGLSHGNGTTHLKPPDMTWDLTVAELLGCRAIVGAEGHVGPIIDIR